MKKIDNFVVYGCLVMTIVMYFVFGFQIDNLNKSRNDLRKYVEMEMKLDSINEERIFKLEMNAIRNRYSFVYDNETAVDTAEINEKMIK